MVPDIQQIASANRPLPCHRVRRARLSLFALLLAATLGAGAEFTAGQESTPVPTPKQTMDGITLVLVEKENEKLKGQNALLRKENQQLRRLLSERPGPATNAPAPVVSVTSTNEPSSSASADPTHWLTAGGKRHNSDCRYFKKAGGRACGSHEGTACKLCGG